MIYFIKENQLKANLNKLGVKSVDDDVLEVVNKLQQKVVTDMLKQQQQKQQNGGRVSLPIDYFGGQTANLSTSVPSFTDMTPTSTDIRPALAFQAVGGGKDIKYKVSDIAAKACVKKCVEEQAAQLNSMSKQQLVKVSKQKFENVMTEVINKATSKQGHLSKQKLKEVLSQKKYQQFKA